MGVTVGERFQAWLERPRSINQHTVIGVLTAPHRHIPGDLIENLLQGFFVQIVARDRQPGGHHAAADVHTDSRRNNGLVRGDHRTDGGADPEMHVRHRRNVVMNKGQPSNVGQLLLRSVVDIVGPDFDRYALVGKNLLNWHF